VSRRRNSRGKALAGPDPARRGSVAVMMGLLLPIVIGMVALGVEVTYLLYKQRQMQAAADGAALGGALALQSGHPALGIEARGMAAFSGFVDGAADGTTVTVNNPPVSGPQAGKTGGVEVIINQPQTLSLVTLFQDGPFNVAARAVATTGAGAFCVLQLGSGGSFKMTNGATANLVSCGLAVDSTSSTALTLSGATVLTAPSVSVVGGGSITNGGMIDPSEALKTSQATVADPYGSIAMPSSSGCGGGTNKSYSTGTWTMTPGVYCSNVSFTNSAIVTMTAGVYFIDRGTFSVGGAVKLTGTNVTIILTSSTGLSYAKVNIGNGANVTLNAPTTGALAGIVFFGDRRAPAANSNTFGGGATMNFAGALYFPSQTMIFQNGATNPSGCTQLIAQNLQLTGGSKFQNNCPAGVGAIGGAGSALVE
jgi:putative Flp pilus-assembly TadE/G-like protein